MLDIVGPILVFAVCRFNDLPSQNAPLLVVTTVCVWVSYFLLVTDQQPKTLSRVATRAAKCTLWSLTALVLNPLDPNSPLVCVMDRPEFTHFLLRHFSFHPTTHSLPELPSGGAVRIATVSTFEQMWSIIEQSPRSSILFKGLLNESTLTTLLGGFRRSTKAVFKPPRLNRNSSYFSSGISRNSLNKQTTVKEIVDGTMPNHHIGFVPLGHRRDLLNTNTNAPSAHPQKDKKTRKAINDISFAAYGQSATITTPNHGHWATDSVSLQVAGRKIWLLQDPDG